MTEPISPAGKSQRKAAPARAAGPKVSSNRSSFNQSIDENRLSLQDPPSRVGDTEPGRAVDLREGQRASGARRPLYLKGVTLDERGIPVAFDCPRLNDLAARLPSLAERQEISVRVVSGIFGEVAAT